MDDAKSNGLNVNYLRKSVIALSYAVWEDQYRSRIAHEVGLKKNEIESDVFYDVNKYRQAILHAGGRLVARTRVFDFFKIGEEVLFTSEQTFEIFSKMILELNTIARRYYERNDTVFRLEYSL